MEDLDKFTDRCINLIQIGRLSLDKISIIQVDCSDMTKSEIFNFTDVLQKKLKNKIGELPENIFIAPVIDKRGKLSIKEFCRDCPKLCKNGNSILSVKKTLVDIINKREDKK